MRRITCRILLGICVLGLFAAGAGAATPEEVDKAIEKAIKYIYSRQSPNGDWEVVAKRQFDPAKPHDGQQKVTNWQWGGMTSVATCALMYARESTQDAKVKKAVEWMIKNETYGIYAQGFRCQVWQMVHRESPNFPGMREAARKDMQYLLVAVHKPDQWKDKPWRAGMFPYFYFDKQPQDWYDHSVSQYGVLAAWALAQMNMEVPDAFWRVVDTAWREQQLKTGGWSYRMENKEGGAPPDTTMPMTAAGLATLYITQDMLYANEGINCPGNKPDPNIEAAIKWITQNFDRYKSQHPLYSAYGVERIGVASGRKYLGSRDWYKEIGEFLVRNQKPDGSWGDESGEHNPKKIPDTAFGLMALVRGRAPVTMNKLEYVVDARGDKAKIPSWNERPREVANITRWMSKQIEKDLNWQIVNLDHSVNDLHDAPILWISGKDALSFTPEQEAKLKQFVEQGGMIVGHADCAAKPFAESFKKLGGRLFNSEFRELPDAHVIYTGQPFKRSNWKAGNHSLLGLTNGTRELMLLFPNSDPGRAWQVQAFAGEKQAPAELMANIFLYAVDKKNLRNKGVTYLVDRKGDVKIDRSVKLARVEYGGNWDPEPGAWRRMKNIIANNHKIDLIVEPVRLGSGKLTPGAYQIAHITGTTGFRLNDAEHAELKKFVEGGGTVLVEAAGGATEFANKADEMLAATFGGSRANVLKHDHPLYAGKKIDSFEYRNFAVKIIGNIKSPRIRGIDIGGKARVLVSAEDLSVGMVGMPIDGIYGYEPKTASAIVENMVLYAAKK